MSDSESRLPPLLEQLGALGSLLIHDMANQMCIISGNATFAQMMLADPSQVGRAVEAISKAGEHMSFILGQCSDLRRRVSAELPHGEGSAAAGRIEALFLGKPGWQVEVQGGLEGPLYVPTDWIVFAVEQVFSEVEGTGGQARLQRVKPQADTAFFPGGSYFQVLLNWSSRKAFSIDDLRRRYDNLGLLAAFELIRQCGGNLEGFTPAADRQETLLRIPYVLQVPAPTSQGAHGEER